VVRSSRVNLDKVGACASALCAVHCLLTGVAFGLLSVMGLGFFGSLWTDIGFLAVAFVVGGLAVRHGIRQHHSYVPASIFVAGLVSVVIGHFVFRHTHAAGAEEHGAEHILSTFFSVFGGLCLVGFHLANLKYTKAGGCGCRTCKERAHLPPEPLENEDLSQKVALR
jgi:hypothetical protein